jgi:chromosome segregation ATPase
MSSTGNRVVFREDQEATKSSGNPFRRSIEWIRRSIDQNNSTDNLFEQDQQTPKFDRSIKVNKSMFDIFKFSKSRHNSYFEPDSHELQTVHEDRLLKGNKSMLDIFKSNTIDKSHSSNAGMPSLTRYNKAIKQLHAIRMGLEASVKQRDNQIQDQQETINMYSSDIISLKEDLEARNKELNQIVGRIESIKDSLTQKEDAVVTLRVQVEKLQAEVQEKNIVIDTLKEQLSESTKQNEHIVASYNNLKKTMLERCKELDDLNTRHALVCNERDKLQLNLEAVTAKYDLIKNTIDGKDSVVIDLNIKVTQLTSILVDKDAQIDRLLCKVQQQNNLLQESNHQVTVLARDNLLLKEQLSQQTANYKMVSVEKERQIGELRDMVAQLSVHSHEIPQQGCVSGSLPHTVEELDASTP